MIKNIYFKLKRLYKNIFGNQYYIVYRGNHSKIKTYLVGDINLYKSFSNKNEHRDNVGFKAYCFARKSVRSFRHDRIISIAKK